MESYEYTRVDRLKNPHNYMYAPYLGSGFVQLYIDDRLANIEKFKSRSNGQVLSEIDAYFYKNSKLKLLQDKFIFVDFNGIISDIALFNLKNSISTEKLLESLLVCQFKNNKEIQKWVDSLVQRFEVTKKIYEIYPEGLRNGKGRSDQVRLYWLFSLLLTLLYSKDKNIKYLSTLLKINDLLCSLSDNLLCHIPAKSMKLILLIEIENVKLLTGGGVKNELSFE